MSIASLWREPMDGIPTGRYCDGWREVWRATDPSDPQGDGAYVWERVMDRLIDEILDCSIYLYGSHIDARRGEQVGGSGFCMKFRLMRKPLTVEAICMLLAIGTLSHVRLSLGSIQRTIRLAIRSFG